MHVFRIQEVKVSGVTQLVNHTCFRSIRHSWMLELQVSPLGAPDVPLVGWEPANTGNYMVMAKRSHVSLQVSTVCNVRFTWKYPHMYYIYRFDVHISSGGIWERQWERSFLSTTVGFYPLVFWMHGPSGSECWAYVRCQMTAGSVRTLWLAIKWSLESTMWHFSLGQNADFATIESAVCECAAGYVTIWYKLIHSNCALLKLGSEDANAASDNEVLPITSYACQWKVGISAGGYFLQKSGSERTYIINGGSVRLHLKGETRTSHSLVC